MPRREYQASLRELRSDIRQMGDRVAQRLEWSLQALEQDDDDLAREVIEGDREINQRYLDLESDCMDLFALQQPVASDLRFIAASFKILTDLERIGDLAANLGHYALATDGRRVSDVDLNGIGTRTHTVVADALNAYVTADTAACYRIADRDDEIDALCYNASERVVRDLIEREGASDDLWSVEQIIDDVSRLLLAIRDLERVADHGVNIAARTLYLVESDPELIY